MRLIRQLWYILTPREKLEGALLLCAMVVGAMLETLSIGIVFPFIAVLKQPELLSKSHYLKPLASLFDGTDPRRVFVVLGLSLVALFAIKTAYLIQLYRWLFGYAVRKHVALARQLLAGYLNAPYTLHLERNNADLIRVTTRSVEDFANIFMVNLLIALGELLVIAALAGFLMYVEPVGTIAALVVLAAPTAVVYLIAQSQLGKAGGVAEESFASMIQWTEQALSAVKEITITGRRSYFIDQHSKHVHGFSESLRKLTLLTTVPRFVLDTLVVAAMLTIAALLLGRGRDLDSSLLLLGMFALAAIRLIPSTNRLSSALAQLRYRYASTDIVYRELLALKQRPTDPLPGLEAERCAPVPLNEALALEHVVYSYPGAARRAIDDVSLTIPRGSWVALMGPTGAGKSTLADLILGLLVPDGGRVLVDGRDIRDDVAGWQRNIGYMPQSVYLIDDTVRRNIAFGCPDDEIDDERVWRALESAQIDSLVRSLPGGLGSVVGERGGRLSGGERQRLGLARALYRDPAVLVIDEGTANLDPRTEAAVVEAVSALRGRKTIIVIAHRLAFVKDSDCIYMLSDGRLRASGRYSELLAKRADLPDSFRGALEPSAPDVERT